VVKRTILNIIIIITGMQLYGQDLFYNDTIPINEVVIRKKIIDPDPPGYKRSSIDSSAISHFSNGSLSELLGRRSLIFVKSYGMGGSATPSFRGTGAGQTQVTWNDIRINNPMLGQSDLSLIPAGFADDVSIYYGGASMTVNSGGIGGTINLETKPSWERKTIFTVIPGLGSFGQYTGLAKLTTGNSNFQSATKAFYGSAENDFRYLNSSAGKEPVWETRKNNQIRQRGFIQELYFRKLKNVTSARIWYQSADRNLPASILSQQVNSGEKQFDESLRVLLNYDMSGMVNNYFLSGALVSDRLNYRNDLASIDSRNLSNTLQFKAGFERHIAEYTKVRMSINEDLSMVRSNNYADVKERNTLSLTASMERKGYDRVSGLILVRESYDRNTLLVPDFSAGLQVKLSDMKDYYLKANISRNSKIPSMNDLFWMPGGNPELRNEYAFTSELGFEMKQEIRQGLSLRYNVSYFFNSIKDMILWHPGKFAYWTADNIQNVNSKGIESTLAVDFVHNKFRSSLNAVYGYTKATGRNQDNVYENNSRKQLMYIPEHQLKAVLAMNYLNIYYSWESELTGKRYITADNSGYLPAYFLNNVTAGFRLKIRENPMNLNFSIDNLFDINYQTIVYYPLPGRSFSLKLIFQIIK
jgi:outer membrane cobalamin receptor